MLVGVLDGPRGLPCIKSGRCRLHCFVGSYAAFSGLASDIPNGMS